MKAIALQKAVNVIKMDSWTSPFDFQYQDETSQFKMECDRIGAEKRYQVYTPKPWESLPYLEKDDLGKIHVRGFLHDRVAQNRDGTFSHPASLSQQELLERLPRAWHEHARACAKTQVSHHRLVFSMSKEFHDALVNAGRNPDMVLRSVIERSMRSFQDKFHPGDSVGYTYGLHHDTDNLHAHVFIHPRTRDGKFVGMSEQLKKKAAHGAASRHKNQLAFVRESARRRAGQVIQELSDPKQADYLRHQIESEKVYFVPRQSHIARPTPHPRPRTPLDYRLEQKRSAVVGLDHRIAAQKAALRAVGHRRPFTSVWLPRQPKWLRLMRQAQTAALFRQLRELQAERYRLVSDYHAVRRHFGLDRDVLQPTSAKPRRTSARPLAPTVQPERPSVRVHLRSVQVKRSRHF